MCLGWLFVTFLFQYERFGKEKHNPGNSFITFQNLKCGKSNFNVDGWVLKIPFDADIVKILFNINNDLFS